MVCRGTLSARNGVRARGVPAEAVAALIFVVSYFAVEVVARWIPWASRACLGALDQHVLQGGAGGDHREDVVFLHHLGVDHAGPVVVVHRRLEHAVDVAASADAQALDAVGRRQLDEVGVAFEVDARQAVVEEQLLPLADHAQVVVVDDQHLDGQLVQGGRGQLAHGHLEAAVADDGPDLLVRVGELRADRRREAEAHGAGAAGGQPVPVLAWSGRTAPPTSGAGRRRW